MSKASLIKESMINSLKSGDKVRLSSYRMLLSSLDKERIVLKKDSVEKLTDVEVDTVIMKEIKLLDQEMDALSAAGRDIRNVMEQRKALLEYLPKQLSDEEIESLVKEKISLLGIKSKKEIGKLMGLFSKEYKGKVDMGKVSQIANKYLT